MSSAFQNQALCETLRRVPHAVPGTQQHHSGSSLSSSSLRGDDLHTVDTTDQVRLRALAVRFGCALALGGRDASATAHGSCRKCNVRSKRDLDSPVRDSGANSERTACMTACRRAPCDGPCPIDGHGGRGGRTQLTRHNSQHLPITCIGCALRCTLSKGEIHNHISTVQLDNSRVRPRWSIGI